MHQALVEDWDDLVEMEDEQEQEQRSREEKDDPELATRLNRFRVNLLVSHAPGAPAPVVYDTNPTYPSLFGYLERRARFGALLTDFTRIRAGSLHRASGGVLVVRAADLLTDPIIWERMKRVLREQRIGAEDPLGPLGLYATSLRPAPVPLRVRVVLVGSPELYATLLDADPDFAALFRVKVEVDALIPRTPRSLVALDAYLMAMARERAWGRFDREARAQLLDLATHLSTDREKLALILSPLEETMAFASALAAARATGGDADDAGPTSATDPEGAPKAPFRASIPPPAVSLISKKDIQDAWLERRERAGSAERHIREITLRGEVALETRGSRVGVVNGLSVFSAGDVEFGQPMRITAVVGIGREGIIDVEREAQLGGSIHTKGVAILRGYLARMFGQERPLSLRAQLAFEQSYGEIDGDSASSSELFAVLSALADVGIDQGVAVTGSVNQLGEMQAIGGVCAKIEGFFDLCKARGPDGRAGRARASSQPAPPGAPRRRGRRDFQGAVSRLRGRDGGPGDRGPDRASRGAARRERAIPRVERVRPGRAPDHRDGRAAARGGGPRAPRGRRVARGGRGGRRHRRRQRSHPCKAVGPSRSAQGAAALGFFALAARARYDRPAMTRVLAIGCLLLAPGCAGGARVDRAYDGHVVAGRAIEPEAYAAFLTGAMAESSGQGLDALVAYEHAAHLDPRSPEIWTRVGAVRCADRPGDPLAGEAFGRALAIDGRYAGAWAAKARCAAARNDAADMLEAARHAAELDPSADGANALLSRAGGAVRDANTRDVLIALTATARDRVAAWDALASWAASSGDVALWARALETLVQIAPSRRDAVARAAEELAGAGEMGEARAVAAAAADAGDAPMAEGRSPLAARLAVDEAIGRGNADSLRRRATRARVTLEEAGARALLAGQRDLAREVVTEVTRADPDAVGSRLVLAACDRRDLVGAAWEARRHGAWMSGAGLVAFGAAALHAISPEEARATLAAVTHGPVVAGDDRVVRRAVELASRGTLDLGSLPPDGLVELAALRGEGSGEGLSLPDRRVLDARHEYLANALADPLGPRTKELGDRLASIAASDPVVAAAAVLVQIAVGAPIAAGAPGALLMRDPGDPLLVATALRLANKTGDSDVATRARATLTALGSDSRQGDDSTKRGAAF